MKLIAVIFVLCSIAHAQQFAPTIDPEPMAVLPAIWIPARPLPQTGTVTIVSRLCSPVDESDECYMKRAAWERVKLENELRDLMYQDEMDYKAGQVNIALQRRIDAMTKQLPKAH